MWEDLENRTDLLQRDGNGSLKIVSEQQLVSVPNTLSSGSTVGAPGPGSDTPVGSASGIVPGIIAAAVFISFLLALYAVLWKCMVTAPKRQEKRRRSRPRDSRNHVC